MLRLIEQRRSIRKYLKQTVEKDKVDKILSAALLAPTSRGSQPWSFIVVDDPGLLYDLSKAKAHGAAFVKDAPVAIVVVGDTELSDACIEDTSIAMAYMQLQAERLGLGSCWVQLRMRVSDKKILSEKYVKELFAIPERYLVEAVLTIGYKGERKDAKSHQDVDGSKVRFNSFEMPYPGCYK